MTEWISQVICTLYLMFYVLIDLSYSLIWFLLVVGSTVVRLFFCARVSSIKFSLYIALIYLYLAPTIGLFINGAGDALPFLALFILAIDVLSRSAQVPPPKKMGSDRIGLYDPVIWCSLILCAGLGGSVLQGLSGFMNSLLFSVPFAISFIFFERIARVCRSATLFLMLGVYFVTIVIYISYYWSGFGRLVVGAYALMPILIADHYRDFGLRIWHALVIAPILLAASHLSRFGSWGGWKDIAGGTADSHHLILTLKLVDSNIYINHGGLARFLDQYYLLFLNWVPRDFWSNKPVGLALVSVDEWIGRIGLPDGYTVSLGMFGEQLYISGPNLFIFSWLVIIITLIFLRRLISYFGFFYISPVVVFDVNLISYIWGGGGTVGSRVWFFILPIFFVIFGIHMFSKYASARRLA
jgi:hypothetical protein